MKTWSFRAEGRTEYQALLFIPSQAPFDLFYQTAKFGLHLYVRRVLIMEHCEDLLPAYLRFVRGVVDSSDCRSTSRASVCRKTVTLRRSENGSPRRSWTPSRSCKRTKPTSTSNSGSISAGL